MLLYSVSASFVITCCLKNDCQLHIKMHIDCMNITGTVTHYYSSNATSRPESNMLKNLPKMLPGISQKLHLLCFSVFLSCLHYAPKLLIAVTILGSDLHLYKYWRMPLTIELHCILVVVIMIEMYGSTSIVLPSTLNPSIPKKEARLFVYRS